MLDEIEKYGIRYLVSANLSKAGGVVHGFLTRLGGVSSPPFRALNFDGREGDSVENIARNKALLSKAFSIPAERLVTLNQVHASSVITVDEAYDFKVKEADAAVTARPGIPVGILTADCLPVVLYDPVKRVIGAVHAGWKGASLGVCVNTVNEMRDRFGSEPSQMLAALGPYIGPCCYTVRKDVYESFKGSFGSIAESFFSREGDVLRLDIGKAVVAQLKQTGLIFKNIDSIAPCTACNNALFFSYRKESGRTGRQLSFIMIEA